MAYGIATESVVIAFCTQPESAKEQPKMSNGRKSSLDNRRLPAKNTANFRENSLGSAPAWAGRPESMTLSRPAQSPETKSPAMPCKHPRVKVVAREADSEFVECLECGEVFESSEFKDMDIEETKLAEEG
jgi:hypothetical protein